MTRNLALLPLVLLVAAGCATPPRDPAGVAMDPTRKISEQDCARAVATGGANLLCKDLTAAERRAILEEEERLARERREAAARAERERLERERAAQLAREEAARRAKAEEEARLAAEAARLAREARERQEREEAEARARKEAAERAEREAREAAARECRRLEQERADGRARLQDFVAAYGKLGEFRDIAAQISAFLGKPAKSKPCPPAP